MSTPELEYQAVLYHGHACYHERQYRLAIKHFNTALLMRKSLSRFKNSQLMNIEGKYRDFTETEIRYRLAICHQELQEYNHAASVIQALPFQMRSLKIHMLHSQMIAKGSLYNTSDAIKAYEQVIRECPLALEAIDNLLKLDLDVTEVKTLVLKGNFLNNFNNYIFFLLLL